jgi:hypothetical protein
MQVWHKLFFNSTPLVHLACHPSTLPPLLSPTTRSCVYTCTCISSPTLSRSALPGSRGCIAIHHCELICAAVRPVDTATGSSPKSGRAEQVLSSPTVSVASYDVPSVDVMSFAQRTVQQVMNLKTIVVTGLEMKLATGDTSVNDVTLLCAQPSEIPVVGGVAAGQEVTGGSGVAVGETDAYGHAGADALVLSKVPVIKQLKAKSGMLLPVAAAHRVTPLDVHTNATTCFVKHLLSGNSTCLAAETRAGAAAAKKKQEKMLSKIQCTHILREHDGALFLHSVDGSHTLVESLPTIERCAGSGIEATEYRVQSLTELLRKYTAKSTPPPGVLPSKAKLLLDTQFFPLCRSDAIIFEYPEFAPLITAVVSDSMDWHAFEGCQALLAALSDKRATNDEYCFVGVSRSHRAGIYRRVFEEVGLLTMAYRRVSPNHEKLAVLADQMQSSNGTQERPTDPRRPGGNAFDEADKASRMSERERSDLNSGDKNNEHAAKRRKGNGGQQVTAEKGAVADMLREIQAFHADPSRTVVSLPMTLTSAERREAHAMAESLGLKHSSKGSGSDRHLVLSKGRDGPSEGSPNLP